MLRKFNFLKPSCQGMEEPIAQTKACLPMLAEGSRLINTRVNILIVPGRFGLSNLCVQGCITNNAVMILFQI